MPKPVAPDRPIWPPLPAETDGPSRAAAASPPPAPADADAPRPADRLGVPPAGRVPAAAAVPA